ncbi:MAG TPA: hypothetical protein VFN65_10345 [Solirubrobacteraceae bacterium]|nr:hypothetical protein [Solirubrobacteraceae bacterium]
MAALVGASIPFAAIYGTTIQQRPAYLAPAPTSASGHTTTRLVTTASGRTIAQTVPAGAASRGGAAGTGTGEPLESRSS